MSIALKKSQYKVQIRRQIVNKLLLAQKQNYHLKITVNQTLRKYLNAPRCKSFPKICVFNFNLIDSDNLYFLIQSIKQQAIILQFSKPQYLALINKFQINNSNLEERMNLKKYQFTLRFHQEIGEIAKNITLTLKGNENNIIEQNRIVDCTSVFNQIKSFVHPTQQLVADLIQIPNCLLQFWAHLLECPSTNLLIASYCIIYQSFTFWWIQKKIFKHLNKFSLCYFIKSCLNHQNHAADHNEIKLFQRLGQIYHRFKITVIQVIELMIKHNFFCDQLVEIFEIVCKFSEKNLIKNKLLRYENTEILLSLIFHGIQNENYINSIHSEPQTFFCPEQLTNQSLISLQGLTVQSIFAKNKNNSKRIWQTKIKVLSLMNQFLILYGFQTMFFKCNFQQILKLLVSLYLYCGQLGQVTSQIQKSVCMIFYNILILVQNMDQYQNEQEQGQVRMNTEKIHEKTIIQKRLCEFISSQIDILSFISKASHQYYDQIIQFLTTLMEISIFMNSVDIDHKILVQGGVTQTICGKIRHNLFGYQHSQSIISKLVQFIAYFQNKQINSQSIYHQIAYLTKQQFINYLSPLHEEQIQKIISNLNSDREQEI